MLYNTMLDILILIEELIIYFDDNFVILIVLQDYLKKLCCKLFISEEYLKLISY